MNFVNFLWDYAVPFLFILTALVFVHELGHYLAARRNKVRVEVFSIGFGHEIFGWTDGVGARWKISAIPLGGYVKMFGEDEPLLGDAKAKPLTGEERAAAFPFKSLGQRSAIVAAGPIANFIFAVVLLAALFFVVGNPRPMAGIGMVQPDSPAAKAGIAAGDRVLSINGEQIELFDDLRRIVSGFPDIPITLVIQRGQEKLTIAATPMRHKASGGGASAEIGLLGVAPDPDQIHYENVGLFGSAWMAVGKAFDLTGEIMSALGEIVSGQRTAKELGGPLRIAQISGQMAKDGLVNLVFFMAALSINLCLINLFPIPMLDGGHLIFYAVEFVLGKPLSPRIQEYSFRFGLILVLVLMLFATWNDLVQLKFFDFIRQLVT